MHNSGMHYQSFPGVHNECHYRVNFVMMHTWRCHDPDKLILLGHSINCISLTSERRDVVFQYLLKQFKHIEGGPKVLQQ